MLLTELILSKKGPLAKVWISAHHERKLSKAQALQVDVGETVEAILEEQVEPLALRMSGQLMLGVVRIYSRKAQYLMDDCKDVRDKITMAFRPGQVDLPADQLIAPRSAITNNDARNDFDLFMSDFQWDFAKRFPQAYQRKDGQPAAIPGLPLAINLPNARHPSIYAASLTGSARSRSGSVAGSERGRAGNEQEQSLSGIRSNQYEDSQDELEHMDLGLDLGLDFEGDQIMVTSASGDEEGDDTLSVEYGREAQAERAASVASSMRLGFLDRRNGGKKRGEGEGSEARSEDTALPGDASLEQEDLTRMDLGFDLGDEAGERLGGRGSDRIDEDAPMELPDMVVDEEDEVDEDRARRESTRLTTPPPLDELTASTRLLLSDLTPRTAARIAQVAEKQERAAATLAEKEAARAAGNAANGESRAKGKGKVRAWSADEEIELREGESLGRRDVSAILGKENYLPSSRAMLALMRIRQDPAAYYLPTIERDGQTYFMTGPGSDNMSSELVDLFLVPTNVLRRNKSKGGQGQVEEPYARKKPRLTGPEAGEEEGEDVELGRRGDLDLSARLNESGMELGGGMDGFALDESRDYGNDLEFGGGDDPMALGGAGDVPFDIGSPDNARLGKDRSRAASLVPTSRAGSVVPPSFVGGTQHHSGEGCPIGMFDTRIRADGAGQSQSQAFSHAAGGSMYGGAGESQGGTQGTGMASESKSSGLGKNTLLAIDVLRAEVKAEGETTNFEKLSVQASRRAASSFFFELLVLGTKDAVKLAQGKSYGDIAVGAKEKLWTLAAEEAVTA